MGPHDVDLLGGLRIGRLFDVIPDAVVIGDPATGTITHWNPAASSIFGYTTDEAVGMPIAALAAPAEREAHRAGIARYARTGHGPIVDSGTAVEVPAVTKAGRPIWVELRINAMESSDGRQFVVAVIRDVSDRRTLQERLEAAVEELAADAAADHARAASLRRLVSMAAHDLRGPLALVRSFLDLLAAEPDLPDRVPEIIGRCRGLSQRAYDLADDLLSLLLLEAGAEIPVPAVVPVVDALRLAHHLDDVTVDLSPDTEVRADPKHLTRILGNLLSNAAKYGEPPVVVSATVAGDAVVITVEDRGPGVAPATLPTLFEPFARGEPHDGIAGAGLGLAAARMLARLNGGDLTYREARPGAAFDLRLPRR